MLYTGGQMKSLTLRKASCAARRRYQWAVRKRNCCSRDDSYSAWIEARKELRIAIRKTQEESWRQLCEAVESDPWGLPYRVVMKKTGNRTAIEPVREVASALFLTCPLVTWDASFRAGSDAFEPFISDEMKLLAARIPSEKALDLVPNEIVVRLAQAMLELLIGLYNKCLETGAFPSR